MAQLRLAGNCGATAASRCRNSKHQKGWTRNSGRGPLPGCSCSMTLAVLFSRVCSRGRGRRHSRGRRRRASSSSSTSSSSTSSSKKRQPQGRRRRCRVRVQRGSRKRGQHRPAPSEERCGSPKRGQQEAAHEEPMRRAGAAVRAPPARAPLVSASSHRVDAGPLGEGSRDHGGQSRSPPDCGAACHRRKRRRLVGQLEAAAPAQEDSVREDSARAGSLRRDSSRQHSQRGSLAEGQREAPGALRSSAHGFDPAARQKERQSSFEEAPPGLRPERVPCAGTA